jgi:hypothetical protein
VRWSLGDADKADARARDDRFAAGFSLFDRLRQRRFGFVDIERRLHDDASLLRSVQHSTG